MTLKFFVQISDTVVIAVRWKDSIVSIGGYSRDIMYLEKVILEFLGYKLPEPIYTQKNKIRFDFKLERKQFEEALDSMREQGITIIDTHSLKRIMF
jgi:hypothetical protein